MSVAKSRGSSVEGSKSRVEGKSRGSRVKVEVEGRYFSPFLFIFNIKFMKLWPGIFQVTNYIVNGGNVLRNSVGWYI